MTDDPEEFVTGLIDDASRMDKELAEANARIVELEADLAEARRERDEALAR